MPGATRAQLVFEDPTNRTLWLGKATPREWLAPGEPALDVRDATTRYGRVSFSLQAAGVAEGGPYSVHASVTLPAGFGAAATAPPGGLRLRLRPPAAHAGKLASVTVGGKPWAAFDAAAETVDFEAKALSPTLLAALQSVVATWSA